MELRYLRYFVAVAEQRHFTRAAEQLGIAQPPLSQQIQKLEREIGTPLLHRFSRGVELTAAGSAFYHDAKKILYQCDEAMERAKSMARGEHGTLRLGFACSAVFYTAVMALIAHYRQAFPGVTLLPVEASMNELMMQMHQSRVDAAFIRLPCLASAEFAQMVMVEERMMIVLPAGHSLARQSVIHLNDIAGESLITYPRELGPGLYDSIIGACQRAGFEPILGQQSPQITSAIAMVSAGFGVAIVPHSLCRFEPAGVTYHAIAGELMTTQIALAWRQDERAPMVLNMVAQAREMFMHIE